MANRRTIRLKGYDYARAGAYFVTICTHERRRLFGKITDAVMEPTPLGTIAQQCWDLIPEHMPMAALDAFMLMPDHLHGIILITDRAALPDPVRAGNFPPPQHPLDGPTENFPPPQQQTLDGPPRKMPLMQKGSLGHIMQTFKAAVSRQAVKTGCIAPGLPIWQRGYYEHIIRDAPSHDRIAQYIAENPAKWGKAKG